MRALSNVATADDQPEGAWGKDGARLGWRAG
jgi:hypothetical protein